MTGHVYVSDSDREFRAVYGVTPGEVDEAIEENRCLLYTSPSPRD